jgi:putative membrane protein
LAIGGRDTCAVFGGRCAGLIGPSTFSVAKHGDQIMNNRILAILPASAAVLTLLIAAADANDADSFSDVDKAFVAKVSQGGMYEVELGKLAEAKAVTQDLKDQGNTEAHDHQLVGDKLKSIVNANGMAFPKGLNAEFQARLEKMKALPASEFAAAYIKDMKEIHDADGAAFAGESTAGNNPDLKAFAAETYRIVQRHLGELGAKTE